VLQTLTYNAFLGIVVGITIALPVLTVATSNVIGGMFATLIIACITICVLGILPLAGWKLDVRSFILSAHSFLMVTCSITYRGERDINRSERVTELALSAISNLRITISGGKNNGYMIY